MARVVETKRCTLPITVGGTIGNINTEMPGWCVCIDADTYEEAYALACNAIRPMVEEDIEDAIEQECPFPDEGEIEEMFFNAFH